MSCSPSSWPAWKVSSVVTVTVPVNSNTVLSSTACECGRRAGEVRGSAAVRKPPSV